MLNYRRTIGMLVIAIVLLGTSVANAQWVFVARKALGRIERMTQQENKDKPGYDVATVIIEGNADKVYETALKTIKAKDNLNITRQDPTQRIIEFSDGTRTAGLKISQVNDTVVHLMIASVVLPGQPSETSLVLNGVIRVCEAMGTSYTVVK